MTAGRGQRTIGCTDYPQYQRIGMLFLYTIAFNVPYFTYSGNSMKMGENVSIKNVK